MTMSTNSDKRSSRAIKRDPTPGLFPLPVPTETIYTELGIESGTPDDDVRGAVDYLKRRPVMPIQIWCDMWSSRKRPMILLPLPPK
jgi:hypothetical protein